MQHPFSGQETPEEEDAESELLAAADQLTPEELDQLIASLQSHRQNKMGMS